MKYSISEILAEVAKQKTKAEKVSMLQKHDNPVLRMILEYMYNRNHKPLLPKGAPPYKPSKFLDLEGRLYSEARRLRIFFEGNGYDHLTPLKVQSLFIALLESIDPKDAELVVDMKDHKGYTGVPASVVKTAFPNLLEEKA